MNQIARCDWLPERARWSHLTRSRLQVCCIPQEKFPRKPYGKSFIDRVCSVKMAGYWPRSFFASLWTSTSSRSVNTQKSTFGQYPAILTSHLVNNPYIYIRHQRPIKQVFAFELSTFLRYPVKELKAFSD